MQLSKNNIKHITSLQQKKFRQIHQQFVAEGEKTVSELLNSDCKIEMLVATDEWLTNNKLKSNDFEIIEAKDFEIEKLSTFKTPQQVLAVAKIPEKLFEIAKCKDNLSIVLDQVQDPGNLGTILRIADWFGVYSVICSENCVDAYNPKTIQSSMGSIFRTSIFYVNIENIIKSTHIPVYGTFMDGKSIYTETLPKEAFIVLGNESNGISPQIEKHIKNRIAIPNFSVNKQKTESLNVSMATAIVVSEFRRR